MAATLIHKPSQVMSVSSEIIAMPVVEYIEQNGREFPVLHATPSSFAKSWILSMVRDDLGQFLLISSRLLGLMMSTEQKKYEILIGK